MPWHETEEMHNVKTLLMTINLQAVKGEIPIDDYNMFLESLNEDISPEYRIVKKRRPVSSRTVVTRYP
jgi:hypothetical protein